ncbi:hypothetical protein [Haloferax sp. Atlit-47N]|uniref:hypothetical protein n=1 Tax=Haloferax sp. Atlit-47N TaxID=2077199 RepID=UPI0011C028F7|nr:hypothetical protein [Haloferax sp. Atlit-47N]
MGRINRIWERFNIPVSLTLPVFLAYSFIGALAIWIVVEWLGITNWVTYSLPLTGTNFAQIASGVGSVVLSFGLLLLYNKQAKIQENQESLMEQQFAPFLTGEVAPLDMGGTQFRIQNMGDGPAYNVSATWNVADQEKTWEVPSLSAEDDYGFPVIVDDDNWLLGTTEIQEYLSKRDASTVINYEISCEDRFGNEKYFEGSVDFGVIIDRSNSDEIWENDPLEAISSDIKKIQRDFRKVARYEQKENRARNWKNRIQQTEALRQLVEKHEELTVDQLSGLTNISESNIEFRLEALDSAGSIYYNENTRTAKYCKNPGENTSLSDF